MQPLGLTHSKDFSSRFDIRRFGRNGTSNRGRVLAVADVLLGPRMEQIRKFSEIALSISWVGWVDGSMQGWGESVLIVFKEINVTHR